MKFKPGDTVRVLEHHSMGHKHSGLIGRIRQGRIGANGISTFYTVEFSDGNTAEYVEWHLELSEKGHWDAVIKIREIMKDIL